jgi:uncharacterized protein YegP (UPF0339 family)
MNTKNKPGIRLMKRTVFVKAIGKNKTWYWWQIVASNGRVISKSKIAYTRKSGAVKSIKVAAKIFDPLVSNERGAFRVYYDHCTDKDVIL